MNGCLISLNAIEAAMSTLSTVPFSLFSEWRAICASVGELLVDEAMAFIAKKQDVIIVTNPVNTLSYAHVMRSDVQSKTFAIRERTLRSGVRNGFLKPNPLYCVDGDLKFKVGKEFFYAVLRNGQETLVKDLERSDELLKVGCYADGSYVISDIDLVSILFKSTSKNIYDPEYGELTLQEAELIKEFNGHFVSLVGRYFESQSAYRLISHGPANRFSESKATHIHYPLKVYSAAGKTFLGNEANRESSTKELLEFFGCAKHLGYHADLNPRWGF